MKCPRRTILSPLSVAVTVMLVAMMAGCGDDAPESRTTTMPQYTAPASIPDFSGDRAFVLLEQQVDFGPRVPGSEAHARCLQLFRSFLDSLGIATEIQSFDFPGYNGETLPLRNVIARIHPEAKQRILLAAHWDSRPTADREHDPDRALRPVPGANDGASGVAVLLHLAEVLTDNPPPVGIDIVLFDGEDYGHEGDESMFCLGSKYFATSIDPAHPAPMFGILLDLVGDRDAVFPMEEFSRRYAGDVLTLVWDAAAQRGIDRFIRTPHSGIYDDHVPLNTVAGIKTINIIDAELVGQNAQDPRRQYWHTLQDLPSQCSPAPLADVGIVLLSIIFGMQNT